MAKRIPIKAAKEIAEKHDQSVVVVITWEGASSSNSGKTHVITYGRSTKDCEWAADLGNQIKRNILHWPEEECQAAPRRAKKKAEIPSNPYCEYDCPSCGQSRNGYENHYCPPRKS